tara:strand:+ start:761 stop:1492 length:732 start_codon:yes stop_codon:yes gene_type:complete
MRNLFVVILSIIVVVGCASRSNYVGTTQDGKMHGSGVYTYYGVQYSGIWKEGKPENILTINWGEGCQYIGEVIENRPIIQTYEHLLFQPHGQGTWWNTSPSCGWTEKWTYEGEFKNWAPSGQGKLILHTSGTVIEGKIDSYNAHGFLSKGTVTFLDGKTTEESNLKLFSYVKDGFTEFLDELELNDILLFPLKVAAGTVIVAGEVAYSPAGQAAIAIQEAKNQKKREEAIYKKGKEDGRKGKR